MKHQAMHAGMSVGRVAACAAAFAACLPGKGLPSGWPQVAHAGHVTDIAPTLLQLAGAAYSHRHGVQEVPRLAERIAERYSSKAYFENLE